jgi:HK97 family phage portal protein
MDLLGRLFASGNPPASDDFWYQPVGTMTGAGIRVDSEQAKKLSAWYRGRDILATVLAMLPLQILQHLPNDGGSKASPSHPLYDVVHDRPNVWQDSFQWRRQKMYHLIDCGNAYDRIVPGARGFVDQLQPVDPKQVTPTQLGSGRIVYGFKDPKTAIVTPYSQDQIFHLRGASDDGVVGKGILEYARTTLGTASATESYASAIFSRGTLNGGTIENPGILDAGASKRMAESFVTAAGNWHLPKVLEQGSVFKQNELTPEDAQMLLSRKFNVDDIARWLGVPRLMLENSDPSFGNAEQFTQNFIDFNMGPWISLWEYAINDQLILARSQYFSRFTRQALVRGNLKERLDGLTSVVNGGIYTPDEARAIEDLPKMGGKAAELRDPQNITGKPTASSPSQPPAPRPSSAGRADAIVMAEAQRILRTETAFVQKTAVTYADNLDAFVAAVADFYAGSHLAYVQRVLLFSLAEARVYCAGQASQIVNAAPGEWVDVVTLWKTDAYAEGVALLAVQEAA